MSAVVIPARPKHHRPVTKGPRTRAPLGVRLARKAATLALVASVLFLVTISLGTMMGWWRLVPVYTGSMEPSIPAGAAVIAMPQSASELAPHQIVIFHAPQSGEHLTVHRIVDVEGDAAAPVIRTKGDANTTVDPWAATLEPGPVWRVHRVIPYLGYVIDFLRGGLAQMLLLVGAIIGLGLAVSPTFVRRSAPAEDVEHSGLLAPIEQ